MIRDPGRTEHHHLRLFEDQRWAVAGAVALYLMAAGLLIVMAVDPGIVQPLDDRWHRIMVNAEAGWLTASAKALDILGGGFVTWSLRAAVAVVLARARRWKLLAFWAAVSILSEVAIGVLKVAYGRPRPPDSLVATTGASFPSGHAMAAATTAVALVIVLLAPGAHRRIWEIRAALFALAMGLSRVYLRAHWLTDVLAGLLLGAATALMVAAITDEVAGRLRSRSPR